MSRSTVGSILLILSGRTGSVFLGFLALLILGRHLGPADFGIYSIFLAGVRLLSSCIGDAVDLAVMRGVPGYLETDRPRAIRLTHAAWWLRLGVGLSLVAGAALTAASVRSLPFGDGLPTEIVLMGACAVFGEIILRAIVSFRQASQHFGQMLILDVALQVSRLGGVLALWWADMLGLSQALLAYCAAPFLAFLVGAVSLSGDVLRVRRGQSGDVATVFNHGKWLFGGLVVAAVYERLDVLLLGAYRPSHDVGIYQAALMFAMVPELAVGSLQAVITPKVERWHQDGCFRARNMAYLRLAAPAAILAVIAGWVLAEPLITTLFGAQYGSAVGPFRILIIGVMFSAAIAPLPAVLVVLMAPARLVIVSGTGLVLVLAGGLLAIPSFGPLGAAAVVASTKVATCLVLWLLAHRLTAPAGARTPGASGPVGSGVNGATP